jgi:hypothetical protein
MAGTSQPTQAELDAMEWLSRPLALEEKRELTPTEKQWLEDRVTEFKAHLRATETQAYLQSNIRNLLLEFRQRQTAIIIRQSAMRQEKS